jgi:hypothetical protein
MGFALGWIAILLAGAGAGAAPHADGAAAQISYTVRVVEAKGLGWHEAVFPRLKPVTRQGAATVWTLANETANRLLAEVLKDPAAKVLQAPRVTALSGVPATVFSRHNEQLITQAAWHGDEFAPRSTPEAIRVGWHTTMIGRKLDQGILVKLVFEDTEIRAIHRVKLDRNAAHERTTSMKSAPTHCAVMDAACNEERCAGTQATCPLAQTGIVDRTVQQAAIDIPEIGSLEILGEWLIPRGEQLLVSFGAHTVADANGNAFVKERLALVGAEEVSLGAASGAVNPDPKLIHAPAPLPFLPTPASKIPTPMPTPAAPSRTMPQGYHADGTPADLPPLPADESDMDSADSDSAEPKPSPQTKKPQSVKPAADPGTDKAAYAPPRSATVFLPSVFLARPSVGFQFLLPLSPFSLKLPFNQRLEIEIYGRIVPNTESR